MDVSVTKDNSSTELQVYIFHSTIQMLQLLIQKIVLVVYSIVLLVSIMQTFWKNKHIDQLLARMNKAYSDGKFESIQVCFHQQIITCYRFDQRFSHIRNPNRPILSIIAIHSHVLMVVAIRSLFVRKTELVNDCLFVHHPQKVFQCEYNRDSYRSNNDENVSKCKYYYFETNHLITMVASLVTWHYALRHFVVKLVRFSRWILFRSDNRLRTFCSCYLVKTWILRCIMYFIYAILWLYLFFIVFTGFMWDVAFFSTSAHMTGTNWELMIVARDRLCSLPFFYL